MDETTGGLSESWETWIQDVSKNVIGAYTNATYSQPYELQKLKMQQLGQMGYYSEGQAGTMTGMSGINPSMLLLLGGVVLAVMLIKD